jgi:hypothetical protein
MATVADRPLLDSRHVEITAGLLPLVAKARRVDDHSPTLRAETGMANGLLPGFWVQRTRSPWTVAAIAFPQCPQVRGRENN